MIRRRKYTVGEAAKDVDWDGSNDSTNAMSYIMSLENETIEESVAKLVAGHVFTKVNSFSRKRRRVSATEDLKMIVWSSAKQTNEAKGSAKWSDLVDNSTLEQSRRKDSPLAPSHHYQVKESLTFHWRST